MIPSKIKIESFAKRCHMGTVGEKGLRSIQTMQLYSVEHCSLTLTRRHVESNWQCAPSSRNPTLLETLATNTLTQRGAVLHETLPLVSGSKDASCGRAFSVF